MAKNNMSSKAKAAAARKGHKKTTTAKSHAGVRKAARTRWKGKRKKS